jgi:HEAT repeat protein
MRDTNAQCPVCGTAQDFDPRSYRAKLIAALSHPLPEARARICWLIGENGVGAAVPVVVELANSDPDLFVRKAAIDCLGVLRDSSTVPVLRDLANAKNRFLARAAMRSLQRIRRTM